MSHIQVDNKAFASRYNREPFMFRHGLADHPLLQLSRIFELAMRHPRDEILHWDGSIPVSANIDIASNTYALSVSLEDAIRNVETTGSYVLIRNAQQDPALGRLVDEVLDEVKQRTDSLDPGMCDRIAYIFVASPHSVTPYHMDRDINFLFQIQGNKRIHVCDPLDRSVLTETGLESLFADWNAPRPAYRPEFKEKARTFDLAPGLGVHQPFTAPHWVQNENNVSVSISMTFRSRSTERKAAVHVLNHRLRRLGMSPRSYGQSRAIDSLKYTALSGYRKLKSLTSGSTVARLL
jgi:hypothetical protein